MDLNGFQLCSMWGVPRRESSAETVTLSRHDTEQSDSQWWTHFYTDTRSEFLTRHHGCYNFAATCHGQFYTYLIFGGLVWVGFTYVVLNSKAHFNMSYCCVCLCCFCSSSNALASERALNVAHDEAPSAKGTLFCCQMTQKSHWEPPSAFLNPSTLEQRAPHFW